MANAGDDDKGASMILQTSSPGRGWPDGPFAYVTLANNAYAGGVVALANSLADVGARFPLVVMTPSEGSARAPLVPSSDYFASAGVNNNDSGGGGTSGSTGSLLEATAACLNATTHPTTVVRVPTIPNPTHTPHSRFVATYSKLNVFRAPLRRVIFVDADALILRNVDDLFYDDIARVGEAGAASPSPTHASTRVSADALPPSVPFNLSAAPELGTACHSSICRQRNRGGHSFNAGFMVIDPSEAGFDELRAASGKFSSSDGGDQGFLNSFFARYAALTSAGSEGHDKDQRSTYRRLPEHYNSMMHDLDQARHSTAPINASVLHFAGSSKPWMLPTSRSRSDNHTASNGTSQRGARDASDAGLLASAACSKDLSPRLTGRRFGFPAAGRMSVAHLLETYYGLV